MKRENKRTTRAEKVEKSFKPAPPLEGQNPNQRKYIETVKAHPITFATGLAGTSKTYIPTRLASLFLQQEAIDRIILMRPAISASQSVGFAKGTHEEKMKHWLRPILGALEDEFSFGQIEYMLKEEIRMLDFCPLENVKGNSWHNAFIIVDEAEDCTLDEIKHLVTRVGKNSTMVICGDLDQTDLKSSGMGEFLGLRTRSPILERSTQHIHFGTYEEIVRSDICRNVVMGIHEAMGILHDQSPRT
ncbi:PhoH family protein [Marinobacterium litorale]|uniref:PhoH family protein n=1 Tax=Marinobacterium litorale TaxID=404770 RepID=UPI0004801A13|nr:PhoH family protein [Marinobacterium litorale]